MTDESPDGLGAALALAAAAGGVAALWVVLGTYSGSTETLRDGLIEAVFAVFDPVLLG